MGCHSLLQGIFPSQGANLLLLQVSCIAVRFFYHRATIYYLLVNYTISFNLLVYLHARFTDKARGGYRKLSHLQEEASCGSVAQLYLTL